MKLVYWISAFTVGKVLAKPKITIVESPAAEPVASVPFVPGGFPAEVIDIHVPPIPIVMEYAQFQAPPSAVVAEPYAGAPHVIVDNPHSKKAVHIIAEPPVQRTSTYVLPSKELDSGSMHPIAVLSPPQEKGFHAVASLPEKSSPLHNVPSKKIRPVRRGEI